MLYIVIFTGHIIIYYIGIDNVESKDLVQPTVSPSPDHWNFSSRVSLAQRMHGSRKIMEKEFPLVHYDTKSNSMSNL